MLPKWAGASLAAALLFLLYFFRLSGMGLLGPDETRYAAIGREMARSGDWITPRLWGDAFFEKPPLLFWLTGGANRFGLGPELAPRLPIAILSVMFLAAYFFLLRALFGAQTAAYSAAILATSAGWLAYSQVGVTDLALSVFFSTAMLLWLLWLERGNRFAPVAAAACLGLSVLAKGLVPLALAAPVLWFARRRWRELLQPRAIGLFVLIAAPWYLICYWRNGSPLLQKLFVEQHFGRFSSDALLHAQPWWFYVPAMLAALFPWTPLIAWQPRPRTQMERYLLAWFVCGFLFFSIMKNKLPGYILPLLPALAAWLGLRFCRAPRPSRGLAVCAAMLMLVFPLIPVLPQALASGLTRATWPAFHPAWMLPLALAALLPFLKRDAALAAMCCATALAVVAVKIQAYPAIDVTASARPLWNRIAPQRDRVCVEDINRAWRYGLNYYAIDPLPDCGAAPRPLHVVQEGNAAPILVPRVE